MVNNRILLTNEWYRTDDHLPREEVAEGLVVFAVPPCHEEEWFRPIAEDAVPVIPEEPSEPWTYLAAPVGASILAVLLLI